MVKQTPRKPLSTQTQPFSHYLQEAQEITAYETEKQMPMSHTNDQADLEFSLNSEQRPAFLTFIVTCTILQSSRSHITNKRN